MSALVPNEDVGQFAIGLKGMIQYGDHHVRPLWAAHVSRLNCWIVGMSNGMTAHFADDDFEKVQGL